MVAQNQVPWPDINESHSFKIISHLPVATPNTFVRFGHHRRFVPDPEETDFIENPNLAQTHLIAQPVEGRIPEIVIYAPTLAPPPPVERLVVKRRYDPLLDPTDVGYSLDIVVRDGSIVPSPEKVTKPKQKRKKQGRTSEGAGFQQVTSTEAFGHLSTGEEGSVGGLALDRATNDELVSASSSDSGSDSDTDFGTSDAEAWEAFIQNNHPDPKKRSLVRDRLSTSIDRPNAKHTPNKRKSLAESLPKSIPAASARDRIGRPKAFKWILKAGSWEQIVRKHPGPPETYPLHLGSLDEQTVRCCAISPRGAKWVVGVGKAHSLFIWRLRDADPGA